MDTILVVGTKTVAGVNIAATLSENHQVVGLKTATSGNVGRAEFNTETARNWLNSVRPDRVVLCGNAARSNWDTLISPEVTRDDVTVARAWATATADFGCRLTAISSDALFTGPWMFHSEESPHRCPSESAMLLDELEKGVTEACPDALIVRTNTFGWENGKIGAGWIESILDTLELGTAHTFDYLRHATPILATDLAEVIEKVHEHGLSGTYHVAGAERVSPATFVQRLADRFSLPASPTAERQVVEARPTGFGCGETSLLTKKLRNRLGISLPMLNDGLDRLFQQRQDGYCERLGTSFLPSAHERVA